MAIRYVYFLLALMALQTVQAQTLRKIKASSVTFKIKNAGSWVDGSFGKVSGTIKFDEKGAGNSIDASVEAAGVNTRNNMRDKHLRKDDFFDVEKVPLIHIVSQKISYKDDGSYEGDFKITIKNTSKDMKIPFKYNNGVFSASFTINRMDYGVGGKSLLLTEDAFVVVVIATE